MWHLLRSFRQIFEACGTCFEAFAKSLKHVALASKLSPNLRSMWHLLRSFRQIFEACGTCFEAFAKSSKHVALASKLSPNLRSMWHLLRSFRQIFEASPKSSKHPTDPSKYWRNRCAPPDLSPL